MISLLIYIGIFILLIPIFALEATKRVIKEVFIIIPRRLYKVFKSETKEIWRYTLNLVIICLSCWYLVMRFIALEEMSNMDYRPFTDQEISELNIKRVNRLVWLQKKTLFIDMYGNCLNSLKENGYKRLERTILLLTYSYDMHRLLDVVWDRHLMLLLEEEKQETVDIYMSKLKWMSETSKSKKINKLKTQLI